ncbi:hypothetical protein H6P81_007191 [Aristolochia fimbriata]|uniref:FYVE-type domain-containing protein n=1 Tax=Aristolochia fimbriata TaxID=158543 RepID=A0AAV7F2V7_ARIFI|nr:hypothetical protein H6P81_007191 [Aristolochia fimbriata]
MQNALMGGRKKGREKRRRWAWQCAGIVLLAATRSSKAAAAAAVAEEEHLLCLEVYSYSEKEIGSIPIPFPRRRCWDLGLGILLSFFPAQKFCVRETMLEKIGLPPKPSMRGAAWVIDASHCQGCASQFTFFNRKHHCRRCGGIFCNSCTIHRMVLCGQGDSPVRICDACKRLEEAARFELRHGHRNRAGKGSLRGGVKNEDEVVNQILGTDTDSDLYRTVSTSSSIHEEAVSQNSAVDAIKNISVDLTNEVGSSSPEELRNRAVEEKKKYKVLNGEGKREEALQAFKRGKELERQAVALETALRKSRRKAMASSTSSMSSTQKIIDDHDESVTKASSGKGKGEKDELATQLRELGWTDTDLIDADKKPVKMSLEGELSNLLGEVPQRSAIGKASETNKAKVLAHKKQALMLKREGKLAEAKDELKKAKVLEKQIEEEEFLGDAESSDDELSALIRSMDEKKSLHDDFTTNYGNDVAVDLNHLMNMPGDLAFDDDFEVTDEDFNDPEMALALKSFGWDEESDHIVDREALQREVLSLKREAVNLKRAGDVEEAMAHLKKAKLLEKDLGKLQSQAQTESTGNDLVLHSRNTSTPLEKTNESASPKSKLVIQRELISVKKKALALKREGRSDEADAELNKAKVLEQQLEELQNAPKVAVNVNKLEPKLENHELDLRDKDKEESDDVTEQDLQDPAYLEVLKSMGWEEADVKSQKLPYPNDELIETAVIGNPAKKPVRARRSKAEIQRELLGVKRKALALRRQGKHEEAEEELEKAKLLEAQMAEMDKTGGSDDKATSGYGSLISQEDPAREIFSTDSKEPDLANPFNLSLKETETSGHSSQVYLDGSLHLEDKYQSIARRGQENTSSLVKDVTSKTVESTVAGGISRLPIQRLEGEGISSIDSISPIKTKGFSDTLENSRESDYCQEEKLSRRFSGGSVGTQEERLPASEDPQAHQETNCQKDQSSLQQDILVRKRKALALKRDGKIAEAREELRQAKILEKSLEQDTHSSVNISKEVTVPASSKTSVVQEKKTSADQKTFSSRDRFKLQQQCLAHKRQALKLRREGKIQESEAESEMAKAIEIQLEEMDALDSNATSKGPVEDVGVEDFLDPHLLSALKSIGWQDADIVVQTTEAHQAPPSANTSTSKKSDEEIERSQLEEQIKMERAQALNLKRAGKQVEALNALRRAKQLEKKLNSLAS